MDNQCTEIVSKFKAIINELVKKEVAIALNPPQEKISRQNGTIINLECSAKEHSGQLTNMQDEMARLSAKVQLLDKKCEELEACSRVITFVKLVCLKGQRAHDLQILLYF